jgi:hypothetical protein
MRFLIFTILSLAIVSDGFGAGKTVKGPEGMWNDGLDGENTALYLADDGTGDIISLLTAEATWSYDPHAGIVLVNFRAGPKNDLRTMQFRYDAEMDSLAGIRRTESGNSPWRFYRQDQSSIDRWLNVKKQNSRAAGGRK